MPTYGTAGILIQNCTIVYYMNHVLILFLNHLNPYTDCLPQNSLLLNNLMKPVWIPAMPICVRHKSIRCTTCTSIITKYRWIYTVYHLNPYCVLNASLLCCESLMCTVCSVMLTQTHLEITAEVSMPSQQWTNNQTHDKHNLLIIISVITTQMGFCVQYLSLHKGNSVWQMFLTKVIINLNRILMIESVDYENPINKQQKLWD